MYDRPDAVELIEAVQHHLESELLPLTKATHHKLYFQTLVAVNVLRIVSRELRAGDAPLLAAWERLDALMGPQPVPGCPEDLPAALRARHAQLCAAIRQGDYNQHHGLFDHLMATTIAQLEVANPRYLQALAAEDAAEDAADGNANTPD